MVVKKSDIKSDESKASAPKKEDAPKAEAGTLASDESNLWKLSDDADVPELVLSVGGTNYEFRKGAVVNLPAGQSPDHDDVSRVEPPKE